MTFFLPGAGQDDGAGGVLPSEPESSFTLYARVQVLQGSEALRLGLEQGQTPYRITVRLSDASRAVSRSVRAEWAGRTLAITSTAPSERRDQLSVYGLDSD
ncbi:head-tail adaptor protein [Hymenobacter sp. BT491]|nr:head-tail adaptor protein [Hymenobacter sp. BT491]